MDSHSFRILAQTVADLLEGGRVEKIYNPFAGVFVFVIFAIDRKRCLVFRHERQNPLLFFTEVRLSNPPTPKAEVMRLRKYCNGKRLGRGLVDFTSRAMAFPLVFSCMAKQSLPKSIERNSVFSERTGGLWEKLYLVLDMTKGPDIVAEVPPGFVRRPLWPERECIDALCAIPWRKKETRESWRQYATLTPLLRESLSALDIQSGRALLTALETGGKELFFYTDGQGNPAFYSAWPLPDALCERRAIRFAIALNVFSQTEKTASAAQTLFPEIAVLPGLPVGLTLASAVGESRFFADVGAAVRKKKALPVKKESRRLARLLARLDEEEARLNHMLAMRERAKALQAVLWRFPVGARVAEVNISVLGFKNAAGQEQVLRLNPLLTVRKNMAHMFHQSQRAARGLALLEKRRQDVRQALSEKEKILEKKETPSACNAVSGKQDFQWRSKNGQEPVNGSAGEVGAGRRRVPVELTERSIKNVAYFLSSDGFVLLRGKNASGNQGLLKIGNPHDFWLHAQGGPSAHLIIRRSHAAELVPKRTLLEAAMLVGEKSWRKQEAKVEIMVTLLRHVHAVKGAAPGTVRVDTLLQTLIAPLEHNGT